jgi:hypothetical protein
MTAPRYQEFPSASIPEASADGARLRVIAGRVGDVRGAVTNLAADPTYLDVTVPGGGSFVHAVPIGHTAFLYVFEGSGRVGPTGSAAPRRDAAAPHRERRTDANPSAEPGTIEAPTLAVLGEGDTVAVAAGGEGMRFLLVAGAPLREPIARYGPFVMNTREEIEQALRDLREGTFAK